MPNDEFPPLTPEAKEILVLAFRVSHPWDTTTDHQERWFTESNRKGVASVLRGAMRHAGSWQELVAIADSLHTPPFPASSLAEAREAAKSLWLRRSGQDEVLARKVLDFMETIPKEES